MPNTDKRIPDVTSRGDLAAFLRRDLAEHRARWSDADLAKFLEASTKVMGERGSIDAESQEATAPAESAVSTTTFVRRRD